MGTFSNEQTGTERDLVYQLDAEETLDATGFGMISNNQISGVASVSFCQVDEMRTLRFQMTGLIPLKELYSRRLTSNQVVQLFRNILTAVNNAEDYMLQEADFLLEDEYVFVNARSLEVSLVCLPIAGREGTGSLLSLFRTILYSANYDVRDNSGRFYHLMNYLKTANPFSKNEFTGMLQQMGGGWFPTAQNAAPPSQFGNIQPGGYSQPAQLNNQQFPPQQMMNNQQIPPQQMPNNQQIPPLQTPNNLQIPPIPQPQSAASGAQNNGMLSVPLPKKKNQKVAKEKGGMSLMYLLAHYSKENLEIYKNGRAAVPDEQNAAPAASVSVPKEKKASKMFGKKQSGAQDQAFAFSVPGFQERVHRDHPGQPAGAAEATQGAPNAPDSMPENEMFVRMNTNVNQSAAPADFGNTVYVPTNMPLEDHTVSVQRSKCPFLLNQQTQEKVMIRRSGFVIGRNPSVSDYVLSNKYIGRKHCELNFVGNHWVVVDFNSKNHTVVDGRTLMQYQPEPISNGQILTLANIDFVFVEE